jgi:hypothetical protein
MKIPALLLTVLLSLTASADPITSGSPLDDGVAHFGRTQNPKPVVRQPPDYPRDALKRGIEGYVDINFTIEPDGSVGGPKVVSEVPSRGFEGRGCAAAPFDCSDQGCWPDHHSLHEPPASKWVSLTG